MRATERGAGGRQQRQAYRCFLVRCRLAEEASGVGEPAWRFTVQEAGRDGARRSFACLVDVEVYIEGELGVSGSRPPAGRMSCSAPE